MVEDMAILMEEIHSWDRAEEVSRQPSLVSTAVSISRITGSSVDTGGTLMGTLKGEGISPAHRCFSIRRTMLKLRD